MDHTGAYLIIRRWCGIYLLYVSFTSYSPIFGIKYQQAAPILQYISLSMALMALTNVIATNSMAQSKFLFLWPLGSGMILFFILIGLFHDSSLIIAKLLFLSTTLISVGVFLSYFLFKNRKAKKDCLLH